MFRNVISNGSATSSSNGHADLSSLDAISSAFDFRPGGAVVRWPETAGLEPKQERARKESWAAETLVCLQQQLLFGEHTQKIATREVVWKRLKHELLVAIPSLLKSLTSGRRQPYRSGSLTPAIQAAMLGFDSDGDKELRNCLNMLLATLSFVRREGLLMQPLVSCRARALPIQICRAARRGPRRNKLTAI